MQRKTSLRLHTLGPAGTNCEAAARHWLERRGDRSGEIVLHDTLEKALLAVLEKPGNSVLLGCVVYPRLHEIVFQNIKTMALRECFVIPTHPMVLAGRSDGDIVMDASDADGVAAGLRISSPAADRAVRVVSHPAPVSLLDGLDVRILAADSNAQAARACARGEADACITTIVAAEANGLDVIKNFGPVLMGYSIHAPHGTAL
ncbi:hypothetical protein [Microbispora sp. H10670]|uniref:hypothetical protein n=1 Tax=Microbispora sp. H10670 TaxID=2729108 RepID=UPI0016033919|nr:hypothetical protein [Microbispora sp. H10670]